MTGTEEERVSPLPSCPAREFQFQNLAAIEGRHASSPERPWPKPRTTVEGGEAAVAAGEEVVTYRPAAAAAAAAAATRHQRAGGGWNAAKARAVRGGGLERMNARVTRASMAIAAGGGWGNGASLEKGEVFYLTAALCVQSRRSHVNDNLLTSRGCDVAVN